MYRNMTKYLTVIIAYFTWPAWVVQCDNIWAWFYCIHS